MQDFFNLIFKGAFTVLTDFFIHSDLSILIYLVVITLVTYYFINIVQSLRGY